MSIGRTKKFLYIKYALEIKRICLSPKNKAISESKI